MHATWWWPWDGMRRKRKHLSHCAICKGWVWQQQNRDWLRRLQQLRTRSRVLQVFQVAAHIVGFRVVLGFVLILCFVSSMVFLSLWSSTQSVSQILAYFTSLKRVFSRCGLYSLRVCAVCHCFHANVERTVGGGDVFRVSGSNPVGQQVIVCSVSRDSFCIVLCGSYSFRVVLARKEGCFKKFFSVSVLVFAFCCCLVTAPIKDGLQHFRDGCDESEWCEVTVV